MVKNKNKFLILGLILIIGASSIYFFLFSQILLSPPQSGWPLTLPNSEYLYSNPYFFDVDSDGNQEIFFTASYNPAKIYALNHDGTNLPNWPVQITGVAPAGITLGDIDNDGEIEILTKTSIPWGYRITAVNLDGSMVQGWPISEAGTQSLNARSINGDIVVNDIDGDGELEVIFNVETEPSSKTRVLNSDGTVKWEFLLPEDRNLFTSPVIGDLNGDGSKEIVVSSSNETFLINNNGQIMPGWPKVTSPWLAQGNPYASPVIADLNNDGKKEILAPFNANNSYGPGGAILVFNYTGGIVSAMQRTSDTNMNQPKYQIYVGNLDSDSELEVFSSTDGIFPKSFYLWHHNGTLVKNWPISSSAENAANNFFAIGDINADGKQDILMPRGNGVNAMNYSGSNISSDWPQLINNPSVPISGSSVESPAIVDLDGDGDIEILAGFIINLTFSQVYAWDIPATYNPNNIAWPLKRFNIWNNACYNCETIPSATPSDTTPPTVVIHYPANGITHTSWNLTYNFTVTESNAGRCWITTDGGITNTTFSTPTPCGSTSGQFIKKGPANYSDGVHNWKICANDTSANIGCSPTVTFTINSGIPPLISNGFPSGALPSGTTSTSMNTITDENAECRYSTTPGANFNTMNQFTSTGQKFHQTTISGLQDGQTYNYYIKCRDVAANINPSDYLISFSVVIPVPVCGNNVIEGSEVCDGNTQICTINGYPGTQSCNSCTSFNACATTFFCGDGSIDGSEQCDDQNNVSSDGCSSTCQEESGWNCNGEPSVCGLASSCGNGIVENWEACDGINLGSQTCQLQNYPAGGSLSCSSCNFNFAACSSSPIYSNFTGNTTNLSSFNSVQNPILENPSFGMINFTNRTINFSRLNLNRDVQISNRQIGADMSGFGMSALDVPAILTFYNVGLASPKIKVDGIDCTDCVFISYTNNEYKTRIQGFSTYTLEETTVVTQDNNPGGGSGGGGGGGGGSGAPRRTNNNTNSSNQNGNCIETWFCEEWSVCVNGTQTQNCYDLNNCGTENAKPQTERTCESQDEQVEESSKFSSFSITLYITLFVAALALIIMIILIVKKMKKDE